MSDPSSAPVLIVGGGLAGLCCARHLHQQGVAFTLFEASDEVGGRVRTDRIGEFALDRGFQVLLTAYPEARAVLDYDALNLRPFHPGALVRYGGRFHTVGDPLRKPLDLWPTLTSPVGSLADKIKVGVLRLRAGGPLPRELFAGDDRPTIDWLRQHGFSERMIERFFRPFLGGVYLDPALQTSSRMFRFVFQMFSRGATAVPAGGMGAIPAQLRAALPADALRMNAPVATVEPRAITLQTGERVEGRHVVVAADLDGAGGLTGVATREWNGTTCLYYDAPSPPVRKPVLVLNGEGQGLINNLHVVSAVDPSCAPPGRSLVSVTVLGDADGAVDSAVTEELAGWFGDAVRGWRHLRTYRIPHALPTQPPGVLEPPERPVRLDSGVFVCGDHLDQASIQGAMVSGRRAAEAIIDSGDGATA